MIFVLLSFFWFVRETKSILFWLYLWQLKEYHIGRFLDHFRTSKGKELLFNKILFLKIFLVFLFLFLAFLPAFPQGIPPGRLDTFIDILLIFSISALLILYFFESVKAFKDFFQRKLKKPIWTKKTVFLTLIALMVELLLFSAVISGRLDIGALLVFDIFTPLIVSAIVLIFQPIAVFGRNQIIRKAKEKREEFKNLLVIGITGSYGKTSTKEFLDTILSEKFRVLKTKEHQNSEVGVSLCILNDLKPEHEIFICEMGAYNRGGIKLLSDIAKPKIGILTGINEQHLATFGSQENIIKTKYELIENLPEDGIAFFNAQNNYCLELYEKTKLKKKLYGQEAKFPGEENILGAMAVAKELGMTEEEVSRVVKKIENKFGGIQLKKGVNGLNIIDATYSANPAGVIAHLEYLKTFSGKKVIIMPCLIELGQASKEVHKRIGKKIGEICDLAIITTKERFKEIRTSALRLENLDSSLRSELKEGTMEKRIKEENILFLENPKEIFGKIKIFCHFNDIVLLESRVPRQLIKQLIINNEPS